jgi:hypothetical protein
MIELLSILLLFSVFYNISFYCDIQIHKEDAAYWKKEYQELNKHFIELMGKIK